MASLPAGIRLTTPSVHYLTDINARFLKQVVTTWPGDLNRCGRMSLIEEGPQSIVRMAQLWPWVGSHSVNALRRCTLVAQNLADRRILSAWPERFTNKTNGVTQRRWLLKANSSLADLLCTTIGDGWITNLDELISPNPMRIDRGFQRHLHGHTKHPIKSAWRP